MGLEPAWLPECVRKVVNVLSGALQLAVDDGRLPANPAQRLKLPKKVRHAKRYLTHDQVAALAREVGETSNGRAHGYDIAILTMAYCGLRWGELSGLRVGDVDLERRRIEVTQTVVADKGYQRIEAPKDYEHRSIPMPAFLVTRLRTRSAIDRPPSRFSTGAARGRGCAIRCPRSDGSIRRPQRSDWTGSRRTSCGTLRQVLPCRPARS